MKRILLVESDEAIAEPLRNALVDIGYRVTHHSSLVNAQRSAGNNNYDAYIVAYYIDAGHDGIVFASSILDMISDNVILLVRPGVRIYAPRIDIQILHGNAPGLSACVNSFFA